MKISQLLSMGVALVCVCGCAPELAHSRNGQEEDQWQKRIQRNYPDNRGPQVAPDAIVDHYSPKLAEAEAQAADAPVIDETVPVAAETAPQAVPETSAVAPAEQAAAPAVAPAAPAEQAAAPAAPAADPAVAPAAPAAASAESAAPAGERVYVVQGGDTLGGIALKYYGSARRYDIILKANSSVIKTPQGLRPGMKLVIPQL